MAATKKEPVQFVGAGPLNAPISGLLTSYFALDHLFGGRIEPRPDIATMGAD